MNGPCRLIPILVYWTVTSASRTTEWTAPKLSTVPDRLSTSETRVITEQMVTQILSTVGPEVHHGVSVAETLASASRTTEWTAPKLSTVPGRLSTRDTRVRTEQMVTQILSTAGPVSVTETRLTAATPSDCLRSTAGVTTGTAPTPQTTVTTTLPSSSWNIPDDGGQPLTTAASDTTALSETTAGWVRSYQLPNITLDSCPEGCTCFSESAYEVLARSAYQVVADKPALYHGLGDPSFRKFRDDVLPRTMISHSGIDNFIALTTKYSAYVDCIINRTDLVIDNVFEDHFSVLDFANTTFHLSLRCASGDFGVIWASDDITLNSLEVLGCSHVSQKHFIPTSGAFSKLYVENSSGEWLDELKLDNGTHDVGTLDIRGTQLNGIPRLLKRSLPVNLSTITLVNTSLSQIDCSALERFTGLLTINLMNNQLTTIEECLLPPSIAFLNVSYNNINDLSALEFPNSVKGYNVTAVDLCGNGITSLRPFTRLDVVILYLCKNSIETIGRLTFLQLSEIFIIDLSRNKISQIESGAFRFLSYLQVLDLSHNRLVSLTPETSPGRPCHVDISYNRLTRPPFSSRNFETTTALAFKADNNPYYCDCDLPLLQEFVARGQNRDFYSRVRQFHPTVFILNETYSYPKQPFSIDDLRCASPAELRGQKMVDVIFHDGCPVVKGCPGGCQCTNSQGIVSVDCSSSSMNSMPNVLPDGPLSLNFRHNNISSLPVRDYLSRTQFLDLSQNTLEKISPGVFDQLAGIVTLNLSGNALQTLPSSLGQLSFSNTSRIWLEENQWLCDCSTRWMSEWLRSAQNHTVPNAEKISCSFPSGLRGRSLYLLTSDLLNCDVQSYHSLAIAFGILGLVVLLSIPLLYHFRLETKVLLHAKFNIRPFEGRPARPENREHDVFIAYSSQDEEFVTTVLLPTLENHRPPFKVCIAHRDFLVGEAIADNITQAVDNSHATLLILSSHFAESEWCIFEFQKAHHEALQDGSRRLVAIAVHDLDIARLPLDLSTYLKNNTYLSTEDRWFWPKLFYALPDPSDRRRKERPAAEVCGTDNNETRL